MGGLRAAYATSRPGHPFTSDGTCFPWDPLAAALAAGYPVGSFSAARVNVEGAEGPEVGFTRPVEGTPNVDYLSAADRAAAEDTLLGTLTKGAAASLASAKIEPVGYLGNSPVRSRPEGRD